MNKAVEISLWVLGVALIIGLLGFVETKERSELCQDLNVSVSRPNGNYFVVEEDIEEMIYNMGYATEGSAMADVDINHIEKMLLNNPAISSAEVYTTINGIVNVNLEQRNPVLRVFNKNNESFYIDEKGWLMPLSNKYTARVIIANGSISESFAHQYQTNVQEKDSVLNQLYQLAVFIDNDPFWKSQIIQIHVNEKGDMELIPRVGNHEIIIGDASDLKAKFNKLMVFYKEGLSKTGWNEFRAINLKYNNQVVCTKK